MNNTKKLIATIYLKDQKAVTSLTDLTVVSDEPKALAEKYSDGGADEIVVFDLSTSGDDAAHD